MSMKKTYLLIILNFTLLSVFAQIPRIKSFSPTKGIAGSIVEITGENFDTDIIKNIVAFGTVQAKVISSSSTSIKAIVPKSAEYQLISVNVNKKTAYSPLPFNLIFGNGKRFSTRSFGNLKTASNVSILSRYAMKSADLDGDGKLDLLVGNYNGFDILRNLSTEAEVKFEAKKTILTNYGITDFIIGDLNNDNKPDIILKSYDSEITVYQNTSSLSNISFDKKIKFNVYSTVRDFDIGDLNNDGLIDIVTVSGYELNFFENTSINDIIFGERTNIQSLANFSKVRLRDINGDEIVDIAALSTGGQTDLNVYLNKNIKGEFKLSNPSKINANYLGLTYGFEAADLDNDGKLEMVFAGSSGFLILNNESTKDSVMFKFVYKSTGVFENRLYISDIDGDGKVDLVTTNDPGKHNCSLFRNNSENGSISFELPINFVSVNTINSFVVADYNLDNKPDLLVLSSYQPLAVYTNKLYEYILEDFDPKAGGVGTRVLLNGYGFDNLKSVKFGGVEASSFEILSTETAVAIVPKGKSGDVTISSSKDTSVLSGFTFLLPPVITSFAPDFVTDGTDVTIRGTNLDKGIAVSFGDTAAFSFSQTSNFGSITAKVKNGATGLLKVQNNGGISTIKGPTYYKTPPFISSISSLTDSVGAIIKISGKDFNTKLGGSSVFFGTIKAQITSVTSSEIQTIVPLGTSFNEIYVVNNESKLRAVSSQKFNPAFNSLKNITKNDFSTKLDLAQNDNLKEIKTVDINGDGLLDIVTINKSENKISIHKNTSTSNSTLYAPRIEVETGYIPSSISVGDINGDGKVDLLTTNPNDRKVSIFVNNSTIGNIDYLAGINLLTGKTPSSVAVADLDNDGRMDIAVTNQDDDNLFIYRNINNYDGKIDTSSFEEKIALPTKSGPLSIIAIDLNNDQKTDLVVLNSLSNSVSTYINTSSVGKISLTSNLSYLTGESPKIVAVIDLDNNNYPDLAIVNTKSQTISLLLNNTESYNNAFALKTKVDLPTNGIGSSISAADIDGDGKTDVLYSSQDSSHISVFRNLWASGSLSKISFTLPVKLQDGYPINLITTADVSRDKKPDIIFFDIASNKISALLNKPISPTIIKKSPVISSFSPLIGFSGDIITIKGANFNTDASKNTVLFGSIKSKVLTATENELTVTVPKMGISNSNISVINNETNFTGYSVLNFTTEYSSINKIHPSDLDFKGKVAATIALTNLKSADLNGDGKLDVVAANDGTNAISIFQNNSTQSQITTSAFKASFQISPAGRSLFLEVADLNGDGKPDIISANEANLTTGQTFSIFINRSSGDLNISSFSSRIDIQVGYIITSLAVGDLDLDGRPDIVLSNVNGMVSVYRNIYNGIDFTSSSLEGKLDFSADQTVQTLIIKDFNGDSFPEILAGCKTSGAIVIFKNTSSYAEISFGEKITSQFSGDQTLVSCGDLNNDGKPDLVISTIDNFSENYVFIIPNNSLKNLNFSNALKLIYNQSFNTLDLGDLDGDGYLDLIFTDNKNLISIMRNQWALVNKLEKRTFEDAVTFSTDPGLITISLNDINGDGKMDILIGNKSSIILSVFQNNPKNAPSIVSVDPPFGNLNNNITIKGANFSTTLANNIVSFGATQAKVNAATSTQLNVSVPPGSSYDRTTILNTESHLTGEYFPFITTFKSKKSISSTDFVYKGSVSTASNTSITKIADLDGDGKAEIVTASYSNNEIYIYKNNFTIGNTVPKFHNYTIQCGYNPKFVFLVDFDGDGKKDVISFHEKFIKLFINTSTSGTISFASPLELANFDYLFASSVIKFTDVADLDNDGRPELVILANASAFTYPRQLIIYKNASSPNKPKVNSPVGFGIKDYAVNLKIADVDADGRSDIIYGDYENKVFTVHKNNIVNHFILDSAFGPAQDFDSGLGINDLKIADMDGDQKPDIVAINTNYNYNLAIFRNTSSKGKINNEAFDGRINFNSIGNLLDVNDFDGDGKPDVLIAGGKEMSFYRNISETGVLEDYSLLPKVDYNLSFNATAITSGDLDGDGKPEIIFIGDNKLHIYYNQPIEKDTAVINSFSPLKGSVGSEIIIIGDNFTGVTDVRIGGAHVKSFNIESPTKITAVIELGASGTITAVKPGGSGTKEGFIYLNQGNIPAITSFYPLSGHIGEKVILKGKNFSNNIQNNIVYFGDVKATIADVSDTLVTVIVPFGASYKPITLTTGNLTATSDRPFVVTFDGSSKDFRFSQESFPVKLDLTTLDKPISTSTGDFNNDGEVDLIVLNSGVNSLSIFKNNSKNSNVLLEKALDIETPATPLNILTNDFDSDGLLDFAVTNSNGIVSLFRNTSLGDVISFATRVDVKIGNTTFSLASNDFDQDGKIDIAVSSDTDNSIVILKNTSSTGQISFDKYLELPTEKKSRAIASADMDGDGRADIVFFDKTDQLATFLNKSVLNSISFKQSSIPFTLDNRLLSEKIGLTDFDNDGKIDVYSVGNSSIRFSKNTSSRNNFLIKNSTSSGFSDNGYIAVSDLDGDGNVDFVSSSKYYGGVNIRRNVSSNTLGVTFPVTFKTGIEPSGFTIADFNRDGRPDIAVPNLGSNTVSILVNKKIEGINISSFSPLTALPKSTVTIYGINFTGTTEVSIGGVKVDSFRVVSSLEIRVIVTEDVKSGEIKVIAPSGTASINGFVFIEPLAKINTIFPIRGGEGTILTITGSDFKNVTEVTIGGLPVQSFDIIANDTLKVTVGKVKPGDLIIKTLGSTITSNKFTFVPKPIISLFSPLVGGLGSLITITGEELENVTEVKVGNFKTSSFTIISKNSILAFIGAGATGDVAVKSDGGSAIRSGFTYINSALITSISPDKGGTGSEITIYGENLQNTTEVKFGDKLAQEFKIVSPSQIIAKVGSGSSGNISVIANEGAVNMAGFLFIPAPTISSFSPIVATKGGYVYIYGTNLIYTTKVQFGGKEAASFKVMSDAQILAYVGDGNSGDITVTTNGGFTSKSGFSFASKPLSLTTFSPQSGKRGDTIEITGTSLNFVTSVYFGATLASSFKVNSPTSITAIVGEGTSGEIKLYAPLGIVSLPGFSYIPTPTISSFNPVFATEDQNISIFGKDLTAVTAVTLGGTPVKSFTNSSSYITAKVGAGATGDLVLTYAGGTVTKAGFTYIPKPIITAGGPTAFVKPGNVVLTASTGSTFTYQWAKNGIVLIGENKHQLTVTEGGIYSTAILVGTSGYIYSNSIQVTASFNLPLNNFVITSFDETCKISDNGSLNIKANANNSYKLNIAGVGIYNNFEFQSSLTVSNLKAGNYVLTITILNEQDYKQVFNVVIKEPKDLSLYSTVIDDKVTLSLIGGNKYFVKLNDSQFFTSDSTVTLTLINGLNKIEVSTDKDCQGNLVKIIPFGDKISFYPNPFSDDLTINLNTQNSGFCNLTILNEAGSIVFNKPVIANSGIIKASLGNLSAGIYLMKVNFNNKEYLTKIIKK